MVALRVVDLTKVKFVWDVLPFYALLFLFIRLERRLFALFELAFVHSESLMETVSKYVL